MSPIALILNAVLAGLLIAALSYGIRLDRRLKAVKDGQEAFARAAAELNAASLIARRGLDELRAAADEATDLLGGRLVRAREATERLERLLGRVDAIPEPAPMVSAPAEGGGLAALLAELKGAEVQIERPAQPFERRSRPARPAIDDDLFVDIGGRA